MECVCCPWLLLRILAIVVAAAAHAGHVWASGQSAAAGAHFVALVPDLGVLTSRFSDLLGVGMVDLIAIGMPELALSS